MQHCTKVASNIISLSLLCNILRYIVQLPLHIDMTACTLKLSLYLKRVEKWITMMLNDLAWLETHFDTCHVNDTTCMSFNY